MTESIDSIRRAILAEALKSAPFEGWSERLLAHAAISAGYEAAMWKRAFPSGVGGVLDYFSEEADRRMLAALPPESLANMKIRERIAALVRTRLQQQLQHREAIRRAIAYTALPHHALHQLESLGRTVDAMWIAAGDNSTDFNWYTKRLLLAKVYAATLLVWLRDDSEGQRDTWTFLDRRIANVLRVGKWIGSAKEKAGNLGDFLTRQMRKAATTRS